MILCCSANKNNKDAFTKIAVDNATCGLLSMVFGTNKLPTNPIAYRMVPKNARYEKAFEVIFVTAHNEYMLQALQYSAADYLLKPVDEDRLVEAVQRVERKLEAGRKEEQAKALLHNLSQAGNPAEMRLCLPTLKGFMILKLDDIIYCEAERSYTTFHLEGNRNVTVSKPLSEYDQILHGTSFLRIHKSFLINLHHVKEYQRGEGGLVIMSDNAEIEVSRRKKEMFLLKVKEVFRY